MKVRATRMGEYEGRMYESGDVFEVDEELFSNVKNSNKRLASLGWMEKVDDARDADLRQKQKDAEKKAAEQAKKDAEKAAELEADKHRARTRDTAKEAQERLEEKKLRRHPEWKEVDILTDREQYLKRQINEEADTTHRSKLSDELKKVQADLVTARTKLETIRKGNEVKGLSPRIDPVTGRPVPTTPSMREEAIAKTIENTPETQPQGLERDLRPENRGERETLG